MSVTRHIQNDGVVRVLIASAVQIPISQFVFNIKHTAQCDGEWTPGMQLSPSAFCPAALVFWLEWIGEWFKSFLVLEERMSVVLTVRWRSG